MNFGDQVNISFGTSLSNNLEMTQYIGVVEDPLAAEMYGNRYIVGQMKQQTVVADMRISLHFYAKAVITGLCSATGFGGEVQPL